MVREINLLKSLPKAKRDIKSRNYHKTIELVAEAKTFGKSYFDGTRAQGYGGYKYDGRWRPVARDIIKFFKLKPGNRILDVGCAKGFLVYDLMQEGKMLDVRGLDISKYALENCKTEIAHRLYLGSADKILFPDEYFDLVISINTIHNLPPKRCIKALQEIQRVSKGNSYVVVDSFYTEAEKELFESWCLTAETYGVPDFWIQLFKEANYNGYYSFNIL